MSLMECKSNKTIEYRTGYPDKPLSVINKMSYFITYQPVFHGFVTSLTDNLISGIMAMIEKAKSSAFACGCNADCQKSLATQFTEITERYSKMISRLCYFYALSDDDFKDLRQDVYANIWRGLPDFRGDSGYSTWIYRICLNTCVSTYRKSRVRYELPMTDSVADRIGEIPESDSYDDDEIEILYRAIADLDPLEKAIVMMWMDDKSYDEIAEVMDMKRNTVATRIRRAKEKTSRKFNYMTKI